MRSVAIQHALIALYRDGASDAAALVEPATAPRTSILRAGHEKMQRTLALSIRALANAAPGEGDRVHTDVCEVLGSPYALPRRSRAHARAASIASRRDRRRRRRTRSDAGSRRSRPRPRRSRTGRLDSQSARSSRTYPSRPKRRRARLIAPVRIVHFLFVWQLLAPSGNATHADGVQRMSDPTMPLIIGGSVAVVLLLGAFVRTFGRNRRIERDLLAAQLAIERLGPRHVTRRRPRYGSARRVTGGAGACRRRAP